MADIEAESAAITEDRYNNIRREYYSKAEAPLIKHI